jgi:hypothetical protein
VKLVKIRIATALVIAVALGGCAMSNNPVGPASEAVSEPGLVGTWQYAGEKSDGWDYLNVFQSESGNTLEIVAISSEDKSWAILAGHVTAVGERRFVSLRLTAGSEAVMRDSAKQGPVGDHPYSFVAYRLDGGDKLVIGYPLEPLQEAVKGGKLAGSAAGEYDVVIDDSSANIAAALGAVPDAQLFKEPLPYRRIAAASP